MMDDERKGTSSQPIPHAPLGAMAKPTQPFKVPKNTDAEPALSTTMDPYDYGSGSGKTYHNKKSADKKEDELKKPVVSAGMNESTETAGTTTLWKTNSGDSPPEAVKVKDEDSEEAKPKKEKKEEPKEEKSEKKEEKSEKKEEKEEKSEKKEEKADKKEEKPKEKESSEEKAESASFAQKFGLKPSVPAISSFL